MSTDPWAAPSDLTPPARHPMARRSLTLGLVGLIGSLCLIVPVVLSPFAWYYGAVARREIDRAPDRWTGRGDATTGMVCGIIGTALLALLIVIGALVVGSLALLLTFEGGYAR